MAEYLQSGCVAGDIAGKNQSTPVKDFLAVNRASRRARPKCWEAGLLSGPSPELVAFLRESAPGDGPWMAAFNMADVLDSSLAADDLSPLLRANLFPLVSSDIIPPMEKKTERILRENLADIFQHNYMNRRIECLGCHNSEYSVTGSLDPALDRTWEVPGYFEAAIFGGNSSGRGETQVRAFFRSSGVVSVVSELIDFEMSWGYGEGTTPWGLSPECGTFRLPADIEPDFLDMDGFLVAEHGVTASVWDLEQHLRDGYEDLRADGLGVAADRSVSGDEALAYLGALSLADQLWREATGRRLTIAHTFPRNEAQRDAMILLADAFVSHGFSLREMLVALATQPLFNESAPVDCAAESAPYNLPPIYDPWVTADEIEERRNNGVGDAVHRYPPRVLQNLVVYAMQWTTPREWFTWDVWDMEGFKLDPDGAFQRDIGVFLKDSEGGFRGTDFQGLLMWEEGYGACVDPEHFEQEWHWAQADPPTDFVDTILEAAPDGATLADALVALKDRLLTDPDLSGPDERALIEAVAEAPLDTVLAGDGEAEARIRRVCAAWIASPQLMLAGLPGPNRAGSATPLIVPLRRAVR